MESTEKRDHLTAKNRMPELHVFDFEAEDWCNLRMCGLHTGEKYTNLYIPKWSRAEQRRMVDGVLDIMEREKGVWYAHYGGKYDFIFLIRRMYERYRDGMVPIIANGKLMKLSVKGRYELRDSSCLMPNSLGDICRSFRLEDRKLEDFDRSRLFSGDYALDDIKDYQYHDCSALWSALHTFRNTLGLKRLGLTIAGTAIGQYRNIEEDYKARYDLRYSPEFRCIREAYAGGRCEIFRRHGNNLRYYDVNSMYPYCMLKYEYPSGMLRRVRSFDDGRLGIYRVRWSCPEGLHVPVLWHKLPKMCFPKGEGVGWFYSPELDLADEMGYCLRFLDGYAWDGRCRPFVNYVNHFYAIKQRSEGAKRAIAKLMLNSLYGKFAQKEERMSFRFGTPYEDEVGRMRFDVFDGVPLWREETHAHADFILPQLAGFTGAYARCKLYRHFLQAGLDSLYYCDTDSLVTTAKLPESGELGGLKLEHEIEEGVFLFPKVYALKLAGSREVIRAKGFFVDEFDMDFGTMKRCLDNEEYYRFFHQEYQRIGSVLSYFARRGLEEFGDRMFFTKDVRSRYDKRVVLPDGINTEPITNII